ncbi:hypothetical protein M406DRAFT_325718 [Cryphonectria parasitica EP155]|uniref:Uncharacterized protein n=1 Tax=Cryphonectria parasitica (strain ATCC 38755 / EP155) TaxID=660469 RepID=A0A9P5CU12_CRYP1|nr:uncharacterized protein M406DRAFT_325718 [Cryphonectria parasitica EP155]KAF3770267.1 hypothetical protein M406DRAFT_325718 [Cryphonectria parasitica EP155]
MCIYIQEIPLCGHPTRSLLFYTSCSAVHSQLMRITEPEAWEPANLAGVPFDLPGDCDPRPGNIWTLYSDDYCGWECRNNAYLPRDMGPVVVAAAAVEGLGGVGQHDVGFGVGFLPAYVPGDEDQEEEGRFGPRQRGLQRPGGPKAPMVLGMPDARYGPGSERPGISWRGV